MEIAGPPPTRTYRGLGAGERRAQRRERLLESGLELLGTEGWQGTTVTAVCEHARLTPRYFYESFHDRDELLVAVFDGILEEVSREAGTSLTRPASTIRESVRAVIAAWVKVATDDPRKGRVAFVEALGSEALMRRRLDATRRLAALLTRQARVLYEVGARDAKALDVAGLVVAGALVETMVEWLEGRLEATAEDLVQDFTTLCTASLAAAIPERGGPF